VVKDDSLTLAVLSDDDETGLPTRRDFCRHACQAMSLAGFGALLQACGGGGSPTAPSNVPQLTVINATVTSGTITINIDGSSPLANVGGAALVQAGGQSYLVGRTAQDTAIALTSVCTHEGCTVSGFQNNNYVCPCHGSEYNTSGGVVKGPATSALRRFNTTLSNNVLTISV
jgi:cytochrome b6-f complex iron-sulfur subunit